MDLILIYGIPATGKLTLAKKVSEYLNFKLLHNHAIIDSIPENKPSAFFWKRCWEKRFNIIKKNLNSANKGIVMTLALQGSNNEYSNLTKLFNLIKNHQGNVFLINLVCDLSVLKNRINNISRLAFNKITNSKDLEVWYNNYKELSFSEKTLCLDTSNSSIDYEVKKILEFVKK
jgi:shikimate kinase